MAADRRLKWWAGWFGLSVAVGFVVADAAARPSTVSRSRPLTISPAYPATEIFSGALGRAAAPRMQLGNPVRGAIVNHHLLAADFIADTLAKAWRPGIERIIIIAPNHFDVGLGRISTTTSDFMTPFGTVTGDTKFIRTLVASRVVALDDVPFPREHGVFNVLSFIARLYPGVPIVPLLLESGTTIAQVHRLAERLSTVDMHRTLVVASLDFAHLQTDSGAQLLDRRTLDVIDRLDDDGAELNGPGTIAVDSPPGLRLMLRMMRVGGARSWTMTHHSNSALETGQSTARDVTSHITGLFSRFPLVVH